MSDKPGRPLIEIDWKKFDELAISGCLGTEIAGYFGMHPETLYKRVVNEKGVGFTEYLKTMHNKGEALLRATQFAKALDRNKGGDTQLLLHLGKHRLGQIEKIQSEVAYTFVEHDPTKRDDNTDSLQVPVPAISGRDVESLEDGLQESGTMLA